MVCLDTDLLIKFLRRQPEAVDKMRKLTESGSALSTTPINVTEIFEGAFYSQDKAAIDVTDGMISRMKILEFTSPAARHAGRILAELKKTGKEIEDMDAMIGAIALAHGEALVTRNVKHFSRIKGLKIETW